MKYKYSYLLGKSAKIEKSDKLTDYETFIMYLSPYDISGVNVCPNASKGCAAACLNTAGRGKFSSTQNGRLQRTLHYLNDKKGFLARLEKEVDKAARKYPKLFIRLNGTSDLSFAPFIKKMHNKHPHIIWYDYTKNPKIALRAKDLPYYDVTFSRSETNELQCIDMLQQGVNVAVVFDKLPRKWKGFDVIDGDITDARFLDKKGVVVGLKTKGDAKKDDSGFVVKTLIELETVNNIKNLSIAL